MSLNFYIDKRFGKLRADKILAELKQLANGGAIGDFLDKSPFNTYFITYDPTPNTTSYLGAFADNSSNTSGYFYTNDDWTVNDEVASIDTTPFVGKAGNINLEASAGLAAEAGNPFITVAGTTRTPLNQSVSRAIFHELAHAIQIGIFNAGYSDGTANTPKDLGDYAYLTRAFGSYQDLYGGVEALAVAAENYIYAHDRHQRSRIGHDPAFLQPSIDPALPFRHVGLVSFNQMLRYPIENYAGLAVIAPSIPVGEFSGQGSDGITIFKDYYPILGGQSLLRGQKLIDNIDGNIQYDSVGNYVLTGVRGVGLVTSNGSQSQSLIDAELGMAHVLGGLIQKNLNQAIVKFNKLHVLSTDLEKLNFDALSFNISETKTALGISNERFTDFSARYGYQSNYVGPQELSAGNVHPVSDLLLFAEDSSLLLGASGYNVSAAQERGVDNSKQSFVSANDVLYGYVSGHNILIAGSGSNDSAGFNRLFAGGAGDAIFGGTGNDHIHASKDKEMLVFQSDGRDIVYGGSGTIFVLEAESGTTNVDTNADGSGFIKIAGASGSTSLKDVHIFDAGDVKATFWGNGHAVFLTGSKAGVFHLEAGDVVIGDVESSASNSYYVNSSDLGKIRILNFKANDQLYVDGRRLTDYTVRSHVSESAAFDLSGTNGDIVGNTAGIITEISGSLSGSINWLSYLTPDQTGFPPGAYVGGNGTARTLLELVPSLDKPDSVVSFNFSSLLGSGAAVGGLNLVISGYKDGYGGIRVRSDQLSLARQSGKLSDYGVVFWSGDSDANRDNRGYYVDSDGVRRKYSSTVYSPYDNKWKEITGSIAQSAGDLLADPPSSSSGLLSSSADNSSDSSDSTAADRVKAELESLASPSALLADTFAAPSDGAAVLSGDAAANVLDPAGVYAVLRGGGGGDTFVYHKGYGTVWIDESDIAGTANKTLQLGIEIAPSEVGVFGDAAGDIILGIGGGDTVVLQKALLGRGADGQTYGVQHIQFGDGTSWSYSDLVARLTTAISGSSSLVGDAEANTFDSQGIVKEIVGNGGGDTIVYNRGYGELIIDERDASADPINLLAFGDDITQDMVRVSGTEAGDIILDLGNGDALLIKGALTGTDASGVTRGIQSFTFADGTAWSLDDVVNLALTPSGDGSALYGDVNANQIDSQGLTARIVGNGGGDSIYYNTGYGRLVIDEQDKSSTPPNTLVLGDQIDPTAISVSADANGDITITISASDVVVVSGELNSDGTTVYGVQSVAFADGTNWSYADLLAKADTASASNSELFGDRNANTFDSLGVARSITGAGGGDTFVYDIGYGLLTIDEVDPATAPDNALQLGSGILLAALAVSGNSAGDLILSFGGGDQITLKGGLASGTGETRGVQRVVFADGTVLTYSDLLDRAGTASTSNPSIFGDRTANTLDTLGLATRATGGGGGDIFVFDRGYGAVSIDERDDGLTPANVVHFGPGIALSDLSVAGNDSGDLILTLGSGDVLTIIAALTSDSQGTNGIQSLVFEDGTTVTYAELLDLVGTASLAGGTVYGDSSANVLDTGGIASTAVGNGGGDTFAFIAGYGQVVIDERDAGGRIGNILVLGSGLDPADATVSGTADGDLVLAFGANDRVIIKGALKGTDESGTALGIEQVQFHDGTVWSYEDLLAKADTASISNTMLFGDTEANVLDGAGIADFLAGNGGGDTFKFNAGYGALTINEKDHSSYASNSLSLGQGLTPARLSVTGNDQGDLVLDFGGGDVITIKGALLGQDSDGVTHGIQAVAFGDGTEWSLRDLLEAAQTPSATNTILYGSSDADILDSQGVATSIVGNGGGDTIYFNPGYGSLTINEQDSSTDAANRLILGEGIAPSQVTISTNVNGDLILSFGGSDVITITNGLTEGVQSIEFADGTMWDKIALGGFVQSQRQIDITGSDTELDLAALPAASYPELVLNTSPADVVVTLTSDAGKLVLQSSGGSLTLDHIFLSQVETNQTLRFANGTVWQISDALAQVANWSDVGSVLFGTDGAETFDAGGHFNVIDGGGGGDTIRYKRGDGELQLTEADALANPQSLLQLGAGISLADLTVTADYANVGTLMLDFGNGDIIRLPYGMHVVSDSTFGIQKISFSNGQTLGYSDLMAMADIGSASNDGTLIGDSFGNVIDTKGFAHHVMGDGGGDTFVFNSGYGTLIIDETDTSASPNNTLHLGSGITAEDATVTAEYNDILLTFPGSDQVRLRNALGSRSDSAEGVQSILFDDGTVWSVADLLQKVSTATAGMTTIYGDAGANTLDTAGIAHTVVGHGGGDTILYNRGYGNVSIEELDYTQPAANTLRFGAGIAPTDVTPTLVSVGAFVLKLSGGDQVSFTGTNTTQTKANFGAASGIQRIEFDDGTVWTYAQLLSLADVPSATHQTLHGDVAPNTIDPLGIAHVIEGGGGGDTIIYNVGYGALDITEYEDGVAINALQLGAGITPQAITVGSYGGALILSFGGNDRITIHPGSQNLGLNEIRFADGTVWDATKIAALRNPQSTGDATHLLASSTLTGAVNKRISVSGNAAPLSTSGSIQFSDVDPADIHQALITNVSLQANNFYTSEHLSLDTIKSWLSLSAPVEAGTGIGEVVWNFSAPGTSLDFLTQGDFANISFTIQVRDAHGNVFDKTAKVYLNGVSTAPTGAPPSVASGTTSQASLSEVVDETGGFMSLGTNGKLKVTDPVSLKSDAATIVAVTASGVTGGLPSYSKMLGWFYLGSLSSSFNNGSNVGTSNWIFSAQDHDFDYLGAGQTVTLTYETEIADQFGGKVRIPVAIIITGSNDKPQIASGGTTYAFLTAETGASEGVAQLQGNGSLNFRDVDAFDTHAVKITSVSASGSVDGIPDMATLMALVSFDPVSEQNGATSASVEWHFSADSSLFGYLADYQTVTLSYSAQVSDGHGGTLDQTISIFVTGLPSAPLEDQAPSTLVPETVISTLNVAVAVSGIQIDDPDPHSYETVTLISGRGRLRVSSEGGAWLSGNNGRALTISGTLADVNAALATLTYQQLSGDQDSILVTTNDGQLSDQQTILVMTSGSDTAPLLANAISDQNAQEDSPFTFTIPANTFTDADAGDTLTLSATLANGSPLPTWLSFDPVSGQFSGTPVNGDVGNLPLRVVATDGAGATVAATFEVAVVNTNDAPGIASGTVGTANIVEQSALTDAAATDLVSGVINFGDPDLGDTHSAAVTGVSTSGDAVGLQATDALLALLTIGDVTDVAGTTPGSVPWTFAAADQTFDYLGADQTVTLTYTVAVSDNVGAVVNQEVVVTVTGTNDVPVVASQSVLTGSIVEQAGTTGSATTYSATGTIYFTDPDRSDVHQASADAVSSSGVTAGLPDTQTLLSWLSLSAVEEATGADDPSTQWTMTAPDGAFDYLAAGEQVTLNYTAAVSDGQGGVLNTQVSVSITGTNDAPEIVAGSVTSGATTELLGVSGSNVPNTVSGLLEYVDADLSDAHSATVVGVAASGPSGLPGDSALLSLFSLGMLVENSGTALGALSWTFAAPDQTFDFLSLGEVATLTYTVALSDGQGGVTNQDVVVTVTGTNDVPVLSVPGAQFARTNTATRMGGILVSDPDGNLIKSVTLATTRGTVSVTTVGNAAVTGSGTKQLKITGSLAEINQTIATLTYLSTTAGGDILAVTANDGIALASVSIGVTVSGTANHVPVVDPASVMSGGFAETAGTVGSTAIDSVIGSIGFTDADASDTHTLAVSNVTASGSTVGLPSAATLKTFLTKGVLSEQTTFAAGSVPWIFAAADKTFDYLAAGESVVLNYVVTLADNKAGSAARNVVITVTGTNDAPVIVTSTTTGAITERAALTGAGTADTATGLVKFTDADKSDIHSSAITNVAVTGVTGGLPDSATILAWLGKGALIEPAGTTAGSQAWNFSAPDSAFDYLAATQTVTLTYTVQITDGSGAQISQSVTITVTGTNDVPVFVASDAVVTGAITETAGITGSTSADTTSGVLNFVDADLADTHILTVTSVTATGIIAGLPSNATLKAFLGKGALTEQAGQTPGSIPWAFTASDKTFDYLGAGQTTTLTYVVTLADNKGGTKTQNVTIAVTGTDDVPTIASTTSAAQSLTERAGLSGSSLADTATGAIKFTDPDNGDVHTLTVTGVTASGSIAFVPSTATLLNWLTFSAVTEPSGTTAGSVTWNFAAPDSAFDYLAAGETLVLTYATVVTDSSGASANQNVVLTITGTNDKPVAAAHGGLTTDNWTALTVTATDLLAGATDPDASDSLVLSSVQTAVGGTVAIVGGNAVFTPTATKTGPASFTYTVSDGHGGTSVATVNLAVGLHQITGTSGDDSLAGGSKPAQIDGLEGNDGITAGTTGDLITGGAGDDTLSGGAGIDTFAYHAGFGSDTINAFTASGTKHDVLQFDSTIFSDWAHLLGATTQVGSDLQITLDPTDKITLKNVALASFVSSDANFV